MQAARAGGESERHGSGQARGVPPLEHAERASGGGGEGEGRHLFLSTYIPEPDPNHHR